jgi:hypothetical protein
MNLSCMDTVGSGSAKPLGRAKRTLMIGFDQLRRRFPRVADALESRIHLLRKAISFGLIGILNTFVDFGVFMLGVKVFGLPLALGSVTLVRLPSQSY